MKYFALLSSALWLWLSPALADEHISTFATENVSATLFTAQETFRPGEPFWAVLQLDIRDGWHTYWRNSGDSGMATSIDWTLPDGFAAGEIQWPPPERIPYGPLMNFGFHGTAFHLVELTPPTDIAGGTPVTIDVRSTWLVCEEICIPEDGRFSISLTADPDAPVRDTPQRYLIEQALADLPVPSPWPAKFSIADSQFTIALQDFEVAQADIVDAAFFPDPYGLIENAAPQTLSMKDGQLVLSMPAGYDPSSAGEQVSGVLTLVEETPDGPVNLAFEIDANSGLTLPAESAPQPVTAPSVSFLAALALAFVGGLILNLMPCVLPVLAMKAVSFAGQSDAETSELRKHGLTYTAGVLVTFAILAGALLAVRAAGDLVGWGFQLQSPLVVTVLAYVLFAVGLNLSGVFEIGGSLQNIGSDASKKSGPAGSFATGALAVVVATPCTAPFMVTALGYAMVQPPLISMAIFLTLGLGLAFPYLALSFSPALVRLIPKPGMWMVRLKQLLAFPMYGSAAWLIWVLSQQVGSTGLAAALAGFVILGFLAWLKSLPGRGVASIASASVAAALLIAALVSVRSADGPALASVAADEQTGPVAWTAYDPKRLDELRAEQKPVFINLTAAWCITCKVNERVALSSEAVGETANANGVVLMKGDWTNRDDRITQFLDQFGRAGVPLYVLYKSDGTVDVLPQVLTEGMILEALKAA